MHKYIKRLINLLQKAPIIESNSDFSKGLIAGTLFVGLSLYSITLYTIDGLVSQEISELENRANKNLQIIEHKILSAEQKLEKLEMRFDLLMMNVSNLHKDTESHNNDNKS